MIINLHNLRQVNSYVWLYNQSRIKIDIFIFVNIRPNCLHSLQPQHTSNIPNNIISHHFHIFQGHLFLRQQIRKQHPHSLNKGGQNGCKQSSISKQLVNNKMSQYAAYFSQQHKTINYSTNIHNKNHTHSYRSNRIQYVHNSESVPLKKFHQYFGKIKPSLYQQIKNIFQDSLFDCRQLYVQPEYHIQGTILSSRVQSRKKNKQIKQHKSTVQTIPSRDIYRRSTINKEIGNISTFIQNQNNHEMPTSVKQSLIDVNCTKLTLNSKINQKIINKSFRVSKNTVQKQTFLQYFNPNNKQKFTLIDLNQILCTLHHIDIQISPKLAYFNVFVEQGNNSQLLKTLIRKRNGWKVVELPSNANLIWTQFYRKNILKKRLHKPIRSEFQEEEKDRSIYIEKYKIPTNQKRYQSIKNIAKPNDSTFKNEIRKLIPSNQSQQLSKIKPHQLKIQKPLHITHNLLIHNHFPNNACISDKKNLLNHLTRYLSIQQKEVFQYLPQSYQLNDLNHSVLDNLGEDDNQYWIIKPGENSNRGRGIIITHNREETIEELKKRFSEEPQQRQNVTQRKKNKSIILQRYIKPLLYEGRKFDIRSYMLVTYLNNQLRMYCYEECYIRTSSKLFDINSPNKLVHLTNDAIQSHSSEYGKYQQGNKLSQQIFSKFINEEYKRKHQVQQSVWQSIKKQIRNRCIDVLQSSYQSLLKGIKRNSSEEQENYYFQLYGMDFMIDQKFKVWLIEVNTNPAITHDCSKVLNLLIPKMLDNAFYIAIQPIMRPNKMQDFAFTNRFISVFKKVID